MHPAMHPDRKIWPVVGDALAEATTLERKGTRLTHIRKSMSPALFARTRHGRRSSATAAYNNVMAGVPASFGIAVRGAAMRHPAACN